MKKILLLLLTAVFAATTFMAEAAYTYTLHFSLPEGIERAAYNYGDGATLAVDADGYGTYTDKSDNAVPLGIFLKDDYNITGVTTDGSAVSCEFTFGRWILNFITAEGPIPTGATIEVAMEFTGEVGGGDGDDDGDDTERISYVIQANLPVLQFSVNTTTAISTDYDADTQKYTVSGMKADELFRIVCTDADYQIAGITLADGTEVPKYEGYMNGWNTDTYPTGSEFVVEIAALPTYTYTFSCAQDVLGFTMQVYNPSTYETTLVPVTAAYSEGIYTLEGVKANSTIMGALSSEAILEGYSIESCYGSRFPDNNLVSPYSDNYSFSIPASQFALNETFAVNLIKSETTTLTYTFTDPYRTLTFAVGEQTVSPIYDGPTRTYIVSGINPESAEPLTVSVASYNTARYNILSATAADGTPAPVASDLKSFTVDPAEFAENTAFDVVFSTPYTFTVSCETDVLTFAFNNGAEISTGWTGTDYTLGIPLVDAHYPVYISIKDGLSYKIVSATLNGEAIEVADGQLAISQDQAAVGGSIDVTVEKVYTEITYTFTCDEDVLDISFGDTSATFDHSALCYTLTFLTFECEGSVNVSVQGDLTDDYEIESILADSAESASADENGVWSITVSEYPDNTEFTVLLIVKKPSESLSAIEADPDRDRYFNLQGVEIARPTPGNIYIKVDSQGNTSKILVK